MGTEAVKILAVLSLAVAGLGQKEFDWQSI